MRNEKIYIVCNGLIFEARCLNTPEADAFANKNGEMYIERITKKYDMKELYCDPNTLKIKRTREIERQKNYNDIPA